MKNKLFIAMLILSTTFSSISFASDEARIAAKEAAAKAKATAAQKKAAHQLTLTPEQLKAEQEAERRAAAQTEAARIAAENAKREQEQQKANAEYAEIQKTKEAKRAACAQAEADRTAAENAERARKQKKLDEDIARDKAAQAEAARKALFCADFSYILTVLVNDPTNTALLINKVQTLKADDRKLHASDTNGNTLLHLMARFAIDLQPVKEVFERGSYALFKKNNVSLTPLQIAETHRKQLEDRKLFVLRQHASALTPTEITREYKASIQKEHDRYTQQKHKITDMDECTTASLLPAFIPTAEATFITNIQNSHRRELTDIDQNILKVKNIRDYLKNLQNRNLMYAAGKHCSIQ